MHTRRSNTICTIIDHVITDNLQNNYILYAGDTYLSDHRFVFLNVDMSYKEQTTEKIKKVDYNLLKTKLSSMNLDNISFQTFHEKLMDAVIFKEQNITKKISGYKRPWFRDELKPYLKYRDAFYKLKIKFPQNEYYKEQFKYYKNFCEQNVERDKITYNTDKLKTNLQHPKKLWPNINEILYNKKLTKESSIQSLNVDGINITDEQSLANKINDYFVEIPKNIDNLLHDNTDVTFANPQPSTHLDEFKPTDLSEIKKILQDLKKKCSLRL
jgi:hypothetical protein